VLSISHLFSNLKKNEEGKENKQTNKQTKFANLKEKKAEETFKGKDMKRHERK
jgi:hypothetical protein